MKQVFSTSITRAILIILGIFVIYYVGPMVVAINTGVLNKEDIVNKLPPQIKQRYYENSRSISQIDSSINALKSQLILNKTQGSIDAINKIHFLELEKDKLKAKFTLDALNFNRLTLIYPVSLSLLALVYFIFLKGKNSFGVARHIKAIVPVHIFLMSFTWYRNSPWGQYGRTVFSAYNFDIDKYVYFYQEFCVLSFVILIVMIWNKCISEITEIETIDSQRVDSKSLISKIQEIKMAYYLWQLLSVVLFGVFGFFSYHFWANVFISHDLRYIYQAVVFNMLWIITWIICSVPTMLKFKAWNAFKLNVLISDLKFSPESNLNYANLKAYLSEKEIVSDLNKTVSTIVLILSFLVPLIKAWAE